MRSSGAKNGDLVGQPLRVGGSAVTIAVQPAGARLLLGEARQQQGIGRAGGGAA